MALVQEAVDVAAAPADRDPQVAAELLDEVIDDAKSDAVDLASFDLETSD